jgi:two-component system, NtrC family, response regulator HydG
MSELFNHLEGQKDLLNEISDGIVVIDMERQIRFVNRRAQEMLGYSESEFIGSRCKSIMQSMDCENNCPYARSMETQEDVHDYEMHYRAKDGSVLKAPTSFVLLRDSAGEVMAHVEIFRDIKEIENLQEEARGKYSFHNIIGKDMRMQDIYQLISEVSPTDASVMIIGESGTGKELVARAIQHHSKREDAPFVSVSCAALAEGLLESELFGHVRGAFTGAVSEKAGRFEMADGGTLFLDEIGEISPHTQVLLLRVLQEGEIERVGDAKTRKVNVRVLAATNKNLRQMVQNGTFREDLFYRLNVVSIELPPLRERREDIPLLVDHMVRKFNQHMADRYIKGLASKALDLLMLYDFPGNVRELENIIEHGFVRCRGERILPEHFPKELQTAGPSLERSLQESQPLKHLERDLIQHILQENNGVMTKAAKQLGMSRVTLWRRMKEYGIQQA